MLVSLDLTEHAHDAEERILLQLGLALKLTREVLLEQLVLDEGEACLVEVFNQFLDEVVRQQVARHLRVHLILEHEVCVVFLLDERLRVILPLTGVFER